MQPLENKPTGYSKYIRAKQAAEYLGIPLSTFYQLVSQGVLPKAFKLTDRISLYRRADLDAVLANRNGANEALSATQR
jgi:excisionase family DNA binding protein